MRETVVVSPASSTAFGIRIAAIVVGAAAIAIGSLGVLANSFSDNPNGSSGNGPRNLALGVVVGGLAAHVLSQPPVAASA